jgi:hypothetical protein
MLGDADRVVLKWCHVIRGCGRRISLKFPSLKSDSGLAIARRFSLRLLTIPPLDLFVPLL